jgi:hypothetical protein
MSESIDQLSNFGDSDFDQLESDLESLFDDDQIDIDQLCQNLGVIAYSDESDVINVAKSKNNFPKQNKYQKPLTRPETEKRRLALIAIQERIARGRALNEKARLEKERLSMTSYIEVK